MLFYNYFIVAGILGPWPKKPVCLSIESPSILILFHPLMYKLTLFINLLVKTSKSKAHQFRSTFFMYIKLRTSVLNIDFKDGTVACFFFNMSSLILNLSWKARKRTNNLNPQEHSTLIENSKSIFSLDLMLFSLKQLWCFSLTQTDAPTDQNQKKYFLGFSTLPIVPWM